MKNFGKPFIQGERSGFDAKIPFGKIRIMESGSQYWWFSTKNRGKGHKKLRVICQKELAKSREFEATLEVFLDNNIQNVATFYAYGGTVKQCFRDLREEVRKYREACNILTI